MSIQKFAIIPQVARKYYDSFVESVQIDSKASTRLLPRLVVRIRDVRHPASDFHITGPINEHATPACSMHLPQRIPVFNMCRWYLVENGPLADAGGSAYKLCQSGTCGVPGLCIHGTMLPTRCSPRKLRFSSRHRGRLGIGNGYRWFLCLRAF